MGAERRKQRRVPVHLDGYWKGSARAGACKVADLSLGGCCLRVPTALERGESTVLTLYFNRDGCMTLQGRVVSVMGPKGLGVQFERMTTSQQYQLGSHMQSL